MKNTFCKSWCLSRSKKPIWGFILLFISSLVILFLLSSCGGNSLNDYDKYNGDETDPNNDTVRIGYSGRIDELPLIAAYNNGYFKENGINAELIKINDSEIKSEFVAKGIDAVTADYRYFKYIYEGLPVKITVGLTAGCIRVIAPHHSKIKGIKDLKNCRIGIEEFGDGTMVLSSILFTGNGVDVENDISWQPYGENGYINAFEQNNIDAACIWEPSERELKKLEGKYKTLYTNAEAGTSDFKSGGHNHGSGMHFTRTFTGISNGIIEKHPEKAIFITKAWLQGANWVSENHALAAKLLTDDGIEAVNHDEITNELSAYMWTNGVKASKLNIKYIIREQKINGILKKELNEDDFFERVFAGILPEFY